MLQKILLLGAFASFLLLLANTQTRDEKSPIMKLSDYGFFKGELANMQAETGVIPYDLNTPLFSDYAEKARFIRLPKGAKATYHAKQVLDFPVGTAIIKTFFYYKDARKKEKGRMLLETRILLHEEKGWTALPYIWNEEQTEAYLEVAGGDKSITWRNEKGKKQKLDYAIPNVNQCKGCHLHNKKIKPIGPSARQLNRDFDYADGTFNQLEYWQQQDGLEGLPPLAEVPKLAVWNQASTGDLNARARAYLDINCGHCHNPLGPANTSGLFLDIHEKNTSKLGLNKSPIAAGRGTGNRLYNIVKGKPNESILVYRMESDDPGIMMPELSRKLMHKEGISLIKDWIENMD